MTGWWGAIAGAAAFGAWCLSSGAVPRRRSGGVGMAHGGAARVGAARAGAAALADPRGACRSKGDRRSETSGSLDAALVLELVAAMLEAGSPLGRALGIVARVSRAEDGAVGRAAAALELGVPWQHAWPPEPAGTDGSEIRRALSFAATTGAPSAELISSRARQLRRSRHRDLERRAAALGVRLVLPLGACSLPAFLCLGVVPVLISMMPG